MPDTPLRDDEPSPELLDSTSFEVCQEELQLKSTLLDSMLDAVMAHTDDGRIIYVNEPACQMFGLTREQFENIEPWGWVRDPMVASIQKHLAMIREHGDLVFESLGPQLSDGGPMHTEIHARLVPVPAHGDVMISVIRDITDRYTLAERMRYLAFHDQLTGLPNRAHFEERLQIAMASADRHGDVVGVVFLDLDDFKPINDSLGHACGDRVLRVIADRLRGCVRDSDVIARMGGDEFIGLFTRLGGREDLASIGKSLVECVSSPMSIDDVELRLGASVGLAIYERGEASDELITRADHAMYRAKLNGLLGWEEFVSKE